MMTIGPDELKKMPVQFDLSDIPAIPFARATLDARAATHLLVFTPARFVDGTPVTLNALREQFGMDPGVSEPCFYNQDWYVNEDFAEKTTLDGAWHLIRKEVLEDMRAKQPEEIESALTKEEFPSAVVCAFTFFAYWFLTGGKKLWNNDFVWCRDRDHNDDRIYVGRYEDPMGVNKNGFNIHRHLSLRSAYSAAPEVI